MIKKPSIIITSIGRTGTKFFSLLFGAIIPDSTSLHEPDFFKAIRYHGTGERIRRVLEQIRGVGAYNLIVRKAVGRWSLVKLSDARLRGEIDNLEAARQLLNQRLKFVQSRGGTVYVESSLAYYGLIDILPHVYERHRVAYIVRDGREWVRSWMNWGEMQGRHGGMYDKRGLEKLLGHRWPTAAEIEGDPYEAKWKSMSNFEKLCWAWAKLNRFALEGVRQNPNAKVFRFEDIFKSDDGYLYLANLVRFVTAFPDVRSIVTGSLDGWLDKRVQGSNISVFPSWKEWSPEYKQKFREICAPLMKELGYESD